ncbi:MAG TPA: hypothetical protein VKO20_09565 [Desulfosalsimonadaceae bacterium]|nr:hypothetical protein [Desulfosalsimonadaceae bacterium]
MAGTKQVLCIFLFIPMLFFFGCDSDSDSHSSSGDTETLISGYATAGEPVEGATVSLYTPDDRLIKEVHDETQKKGTFLVSVPHEKIRDGFRIEVKDGKLTESDIAFTETLRAVGFTGEDAEEGIHVGFASTLLAGYLDRNPESDPEKAKRKVSGFLGIAPSRDFQKDLFLRNFSEAAFAGEASMSGGTDFFMETLLDEMDKGYQDAYSFAPSGYLQSAKSQIMTKFAKGFIKGAGGKVGGRVTGWVLDSLFGSDDSMDQEIIDEIQDVGSQVHELKEELKDFEQAIGDEIKNVKYHQIIDGHNLEDKTDTIDSLIKTYMCLCDSMEQDDDEWRSYADDLKDALEDNEGTLKTFLIGARKAMLGDADNRSAIRVWGELQMDDAVKEKRNSEVFAQFQKWAHYQALALNLLLEQLHLKGNEEKLAQTFVADYQESMKKQVDIFLESVEGMMLISHHLYDDSNYNGPYADEWDVFLNMDFGNPKPHGAYEPDTLVQADEIAASYLGLGRTLTVRLAKYDLVDSEVPKPALKDVGISVIDQLDNEYEPDRVSFITFDQQKGNTAIDSDVRLIWKLKRYVFSDTLDPGGWGFDFHLRNINQDCPKWDYSGGLPILHQAYLDRNIYNPLNECHNIFVHAWATDY